MGNSTPRCAKCLGKIKKMVRDVEGNKFCSEFCRSEWWAERRRSEQEVYRWWRGE